MLENDWTIIDRARRADPGMLIELFGEIDVKDRRPSENTLGLCSASGRSTLVDLSEKDFRRATLRPGIPHN